MCRIELGGIDGWGGGVDNCLQGGKYFGHITDSFGDLGFGLVRDRGAGFGGGEDPYDGS